MKTLQLDGYVSILKENDHDIFEKAYYGKFIEKKGKVYNPSTDVLFCFTPTWWRYTNWKGPEGKLIITSEDKK
ncbi:MAG: hypothetical protein V4665_02760 [Patescibacteria group bacterium]